MNRTGLVITGLVGAVAVLGTLLAAELLRGGSRYALAQVSEGTAAGYVIALSSPPREARLPLFLIDTKTQTILVYEYDQSRRLFFLRVARSFRNDRELIDNAWGQMDVYAGPTVAEIGQFLRQQGGGF